jgi:peroxiredoxin
MQMQKVTIGVLSAVLILAASAGIALADNHESKAEIGKAAPEFTLKGIDGKEYKLADYKDKIVVLEWFNAQCPFVRGASKAMAETSAKYAKQGVVWLAIDSTHKDHRDFRKPEQLAEYAKGNNLNYPILKDSDGKVGQMYGAKTTPHMYIINKGELVYVGGYSNVKGVKPGDRNYIAESLDALLDGKSVPASTTKNKGCSIKYQP